MKFKEPDRKAKSHKGQNGRVLVVGGSEDFVGAVTLAGVAAMRAGTDLVVVAAPEKVAWAVHTHSPDLITMKLPGKYLKLSHYSKIKKMADKADVVLLGNGAGLRKTTQDLMKKLSKLPGKKVIDADAVKVVDKTVKNSILTPHKRELEHFLKNSKSKSKTPKQIQKEMKSFLKSNVLLLKGPTDYILHKDKIVRNTNGNSGLTKGGTGDVLAGLCAGYYAQIDGFQAAQNAAFIVGKIADTLKKKKKYTYLASDLIEDMEKF